MTREKFQKYEAIRKSGRTNMFDVSVVTMLSHGVLSRADCFDIMKKYAEYSLEFGVAAEESDD